MGPDLPEGILPVKHLRFGPAGGVFVRVGHAHILAAGVVDLVHLMSSECGTFKTVKARERRKAASAAERSWHI